MKLRDRIINLKYSKHAINRLEERGHGLFVIPYTIKITKENLYKIHKNELGNIDNIIIKLKYNYNTSLFLCVDPMKNYIRTLWFRVKKRNPL